MRSSDRSFGAHCLLVWLLFAAPTLAKDKPTPSSLFTDKATLAVQITAPISDVMRNRDDDNYHGGTFRYLDSSGNAQEMHVGIRARGNFRRRKNVCPFAPLRLDFDEKQTNNTLFAGQDKLKLVTHCKHVRSSYEPYVLKEYVAYQILQLMTELSYRVRLLQITYIDTSRRNRSLTKYAFLIEDKEHVAARIGNPLSGVSRIELQDLVPVQTNLVTVFEYFIGNTDFSAVLGAKDEACCHNVSLFEADENRYLPIPYDFDFSGLVNTPYATPNPKYHIQAVTDRLYRGLCSNNTLLDGTLQKFRDLEPEIRQLVDQQEGLRRSARRSMHNYIDRFYEIVESDKNIKRYLLDACS